ncbi:MAG: ArnT family glycosyltransferase [Ruminococcus sp.]
MNRNKPDSIPLCLTESCTEKFLKALGAHPYLSALLICLLINPFYLGSAENVPANALMLEVLAVLAVGGGILLWLYRQGKLEKKTAIALGAVFLLLTGLGTKLYHQSEQKGLWMLLDGCCILLVLYYLTQNQKQSHTRRTALLFMGMSFFLKYYYVFYTSVYERQHDVGKFGGEIGHTGYMEYLLANHHLPDFDPRGHWQFYHPPLHHSICALWIDLSENLLGVGHNAARESLQTLTLFYAMAILITSYRILRHFKLEGMGLYAPLLLLAFHPSFTLFSGSINNDVLSVVFILGAVLCTLQWYDNPTMKGILKIALCVGLGMMTKLSAALVAIPIAVVFLIVLVQKLRRREWRILGQYGVFAAVCVPLGLWYPIRNWARFDVPLTYVQELDPGLRQYIGDQDFFSRITDFSSTQFQSVFEQWLQKDGSGYNEYNPLVALLKNALFGEYINESTLVYNQTAISLATVFFWLNVVLAAGALVCMVVLCFRKCAMDKVEKLFFVSFYVSMMVNFYYLAASSPFTCSMNFRYITPTVLMGALFLGMAVQKLRQKQTAGRVIAIGMQVLCGCFALCSFVLYAWVCLPNK